MSLDFLVDLVGIYDDLQVHEIYCFINLTTF